MTRSPLCRPHVHRLSRRQWLGATGAACAGGLFQPVFGEAVRKKRKQVLFVWLDGGISQLESWGPKPNTPFGGPFRAIPTSVPGIHVSELLPRAAKLMHKLTVVRSLCTKDDSHSAGVDPINPRDPKPPRRTYPDFLAALTQPP